MALFMLLVPYIVVASEGWMSVNYIPIFEWGTVKIYSGGNYNSTSKGFSMYPVLDVSGIEYYGEKEQLGLGASFMLGYNYSVATTSGLRIESSQTLFAGRLTFQYRQPLNERIDLEAGGGIQYSSSLTHSTILDDSSMTFGPTLGSGVLFKISDSLGFRTGMNIYMPLVAKVSSLYNYDITYFGLDVMPYIGMAFKYR